MKMVRFCLTLAEDQERSCSMAKEEFYTEHQEVLFDNTKQKISFLYDKGSDYDPGTYKMEVYTDDYLMGSSQFVVK